MAHLTYTGSLCLLVILILSLIVVVCSQTTKSILTVPEAGNSTITTPTVAVIVTEHDVVFNGSTVQPPVHTPDPTELQQSSPSVNTTSGMVSGSRIRLPSGSVYTYLGIPYAAPPLGDLRFAKPQPREPWNDTYKALEFGPSCAQSNPDFGKSIEEDCLSLNVFVPNTTDAELVPVMAYIHGGSFLIGGSSTFHGYLLALHGQVMVVTINYRLGVFGFLSTNDDCARGNWGLWDQRLALQWVKDNAERFGGDPNQITIFGNSAGGSSVLYQVLSPLNTNELFQRAISQSAPLFSQLRNDVSIAAGLTGLLGKTFGLIEPNNSSLLIQLLRNQTAESLLDASIKLQYASSPGYFFPVTDGEFIRNTDFETSARINQYDTLLGINKGDASAFYNGEDTGQSRVDFQYLIKYIVELFCPRNRAECKGRDSAVQAAIFAYNNIQGLDDDANNLILTGNIALDVIFASFALNIARLHSKAAAGNTSTFVYEFAYENTTFYRPGASRNIVPNPFHVEELFYIFGQALENGNPEQKELSASFIRYWTNFARNGDPNIGNIDNTDVTWPEFDMETQSYLILKPNATVGHNFAADSYAFWYEYVQNLIDENAGDGAQSCPLNAEVPVWESLAPPETNKYDISGKDGVFLGSVNGNIITTTGIMGPSRIDVIQGIPYAKPPVESLRFAPPKNAEPWEGTLDGTLPAPSCPSSDERMNWDEDCLTLDIAAPNDQNSLPVIVFINGIRFLSGGHTPSAEILASGTNSVVVTIRYRVGAFGFLSTGDTSAKGNFGFLDVITALKWVNNYIHNFGGDPNQVTLMGYGSGGSIVNLMLLSKLGDGLFQRAISLGGTATDRMLQASQKMNPLKQAILLGNQVGCKQKKTKYLMTCLRQNTTVSDILSATKSFSPPLRFFPVVDNYFLDDSISNLLQIGAYHTVDYLIGITEVHVAPKLMTMMKKTDACPTEDEFRNHISYLVGMHIKDPGPIRKIIAEEYLENLPSPSIDNQCPLLARLNEFLNDFDVVIPTLNAAKAHVDAGGKVFLYSFQQPPKYRSMSAQFPSSDAPPFEDDLQYVFGLPYAAEKPGCYGPEDRQTTLVLLKMLRNFITSGDPNVDVYAEWPIFESNSRLYYKVDACPTVSETGFGNSRLRFWTEIIPLLQESAPPTPEEKEKCIVGEELGLNLSPSAAASLIETLIGIIIALLVVILLIAGACFGLKKQIKDNKSSEYDIEHVPTAWITRDEEESPHL